ncbi:MAG: response regulator transcription factor [Candidatus Acidiferrum sp.]
MSVRILIVDDHEVLREGVRSIITRARPQWEICGEASDGAEAVASAQRLKPSVILLDITMPGISGLEAASRITAFGLDSKILIFTMHQSAQLANDARRVGASGYVTKSDAARYLILAIETILSGGTFFGDPQQQPLPSDPPGSVGSGILFLDTSLRLRPC